MVIPKTIPGLRVATILLAGYVFLWVSLEGDLRRVGLLGVWSTVVMTFYLIQRFLGGRQVSLRVWLVTTSVVGLIIGAGSVLLTLFFMVLKTGIHAHGPEFIPAEISWVWSQLPWWSLTGLVGGLGIGLVTAAIASMRVAHH